MNTKITGKIIVVGDNIDTDQIYRPQGNRQPLPLRRQ